MTIVNIKDFEKVSKCIDKEKYHLCIHIKHARSGSADYSNFYVDGYSLYRKDMSWEKYFSDENKPVLASSKGNDFEDLKEWVKENCI